MKNQVNNYSNLEAFANLQLNTNQAEEVKGGFIIIEEVIGG